MSMTPHLESQCESVRASFSDYLDGAISGHAMQQIAQHLEACPACTQEFAAWRTVQDSVAMLRPAKAPENLGLKLRLAISRERVKHSSSIFDTIALRWENAVRPMLIQVSAGFAVAVMLLGSIGFLLGAVAAPPAVLANDEPLGAMTAPHYLYSAEQPRAVVTDRDATIVVEAQVNARGQVYDYDIVSGPNDPVVRSQVVDQLLLSVFEPARVFGSPVRGRVVLTFAGVSVRG
ncbi:zf-HC2 domain-containing protein [Granulicella arctica]|uniref:Anti-sigma factor RsiW n=1 Tax=Granulicella arctica TaxID=940613 RepID=A0A7Y9TF66_9BACT|nr:zf-HC2 domain-containing protein [Granulicella arctica]NYF78009.1 anti-sigma factor RsiW [Granulicella arctica]